MATPLPSTNSTLGLFAPPSQVGPPSPLLADNIDLDTRDFASLFTSIDPIDAAVITALGTARSSGAAVQDFGLAPAPDKMDGSHDQVVASQCQAALQHLINNGDIQYLGAEPDVDDGANQTFHIRVKYRNLRAMDQEVRTAKSPYPVS